MLKTLILVALIFACPAMRRSARRAREAFEALAEPAAEWVDEHARNLCSYMTAAFVDAEPGEGARFCYE